jgi:ribonuclease P protein subunit RPR2
MGCLTIGGFLLEAIRILAIIHLLDADTYIWAIYLKGTSMAAHKRREFQKKPYNVEMAEQRIDRLFSLAEKAFPTRPELADRYVDIAKRISMRHRVSIPGQYKKRICKQCGSYLMPGKNSRIRLDGKNLIITCQNCGAIKRYPYK